MADERKDREELRNKQSQIDLEILTLLHKRAALSREFGRKHEGVHVPAIDTDAIDVLTAQKGDLSPEAVGAVFRQIHGVCRPLEGVQRVAYVGVEGDGANVAALQRFGAADFLGVGTVQDAIDQVLRQRADSCVIPFESADQGPLLATLMALRSTELKMVAVLEVSTSLCIMSQGSQLEKITKIYATTQDRAAAEHHLAEQLGGVVLLDASSPQRACDMAKDDPTAAALALEPLGNRYGLTVLVNSVSDSADPRMRYAVVSNRPASRSGHDATAVILGVNNEPGALFEALKHFAERGINLRKIQSRTSDVDQGEYLFFLEVSGHITDRPVVTALEGLKKSIKTLKILGSYAI